MILPRSYERGVYFKCQFVGGENRTLQQKKGFGPGNVKGLDSFFFFDKFCL